MAPAERRALILLLSLAVVGHAVRLAVNRPAEAPGDVELIRSLPGQSPLAHKDSTIALSRPLGGGERIDLDRASALEIARLPRVGPGLAKRIVADRDARGPFGNLTGLDRVPGVGASVLESIREHAVFSDSTSVALSAYLSRASAGMISLNTASAAELEAVPGIGPRRADAIIRDRERNGPFPSVDALARIPGIKPALVARVRQRLQVP
jgi:competence ComEA-like helix-hairpin-helix protein